MFLSRLPHPVSVLLHLGVTFQDKELSLSQKDLEVLRVLDERSAHTLPHVPATPSDRPLGDLREHKGLLGGWVWRGSLDPRLYSLRRTRGPLTRLVVPVSVETVHRCSPLSEEVGYDLLL